ncbi:hypothetical protein [Rhabdothermincola salaria]|uniref:hypothetical protein n=1 Tax=Rhabdothermincola salaria TaxID=2903142 RepID=UPI001E63DED7|nr:hypothetical protein [Rhabdothermincola salaria]MCD9622590.1 hypothetical protein [Rhabdothermincola salaria]
MSRDQIGPSDLPESLTRLTGYGVDLVFVDGDQRSYKKLIPTVERFPTSLVATADDDVLYPRHWLRQLLEVHSRCPGTVVAHRALAMECSDGVVAPYATWKEARSDTTPALTFPVGVGGVLYPPGALAPMALDHALAERFCPTADDVWFKVSAVLNGTGAVRVPRPNVLYLPPNGADQSSALKHDNVTGGSNDAQIHRVLEHFAPQLRAVGFSAGLGPGDPSERPPR